MEAGWKWREGMKEVRWVGLEGRGSRDEGVGLGG